WFTGCSSNRRTCGPTSTPSACSRASASWRSRSSSCSSAPNRAPAPQPRTDCVTRSLTRSGPSPAAGLCYDLGRDMTPDRIRLRALVEVGEDAGTLHVHNRRMLLFDADAMGLLRKQLIEGLGVDAARKIIGTFGYGRGYREALAARDFYHPASFEEW